MRTIIYIDGFNLYFRLLKSRPSLKWLNPKLLAENLLSKNNNIVHINYYTANVSGRLDPHAPRRQQIYFDALVTLPELTIHKGMFLTSEKWAGLVLPPEFLPETQLPQPWPDVVRVLNIEEKGSDVNLASHLLLDAFQDKYDVAVVLSNDSDLVEPIRLVSQELGITVGLLSPVRSPNPELERVSAFVKRIRAKHLKLSQFDDHLVMPNGKKISKPASWKEDDDIFQG